MTDGRPIESAPKDGREFLAYDPVTKCFDVVTSLRTFADNWETVSTQYDQEYGPLSDDFQAERATLWWPLPDTP